MRIDDCSGLRGHRLKSCSRCGHQFDGLRLTRLNCDQLNAIKDKESQFGFRWKLSDWAVGEVVKVDLCPSCYSDVANLIDTNEMVDKLKKMPYTVRSYDCSSEYPAFLTKQLNIPMRTCQICHNDLPKYDFVNIPPKHYITSDILMNPDDYFVRWPPSEKQSFLKILSRSVHVKVCPQCYDGLVYEYRSNQVQRKRIIRRRIKNRNDMIDAAAYAMHSKSFDNRLIKTEERKMENVNETKKNTFAIDRNYDDIDRKLFKLEETEPGDIIRLATDAEKQIYMVVDTSKVKDRIKAKENEATNTIWCVCMQTQEVVELGAESLIYVYNPDYIALRLGRFIEDA